MQHVIRLSMAFGLALVSLGAGMRVYADMLVVSTEKQLLANRPANPARTEHSAQFFDKADGPSTRISLPGYDLWNTLEPVSTQINPMDDQLSWQVTDAGWHVYSGWPGANGNVVIAGHSPSQDPAVWERSIFRQLAYLKPDEEIDLTAGTHQYRYRVEQVFAVSTAEADSPAATAWLSPDLGERLTLVTCWPPNTAAFRVLAVAYPLQSEVKQ